MHGISEQLVEAIVRAVIAELKRRGVEISGSMPAAGPVLERREPTSMEIDFSEYKTPVLTERLVRGAGPGIVEIIVPAGTLCTEGARDLLQKRKLTLTTRSPSH
jgi:hypothetical protein